ncbi:MAG: histidine kinase [Bacteroidetes bacterium]|nr:histidine kinase [Bacteroidota bacterium]
MNTERPFWVTFLINCVIWVFLFFIPFLLMEPRGGISSYLLRIGTTATLTVIVYYLNYLFLIPKYLFKRKFLAYTLVILLTLVISCVLVDLYYYFVVSVVQNWHHRPEPIFSRGMWVPLFPLLTGIAIGISIRLAKEWARNEKERRELQGEKLLSELAFLKSQVNPHFLFNTLNNICSLARKKSDDTESAIIKLSQIMRYMITDSRQDKVGLEEEVEYLNNFIELQKIRLADKVDIRFTIEGDLPVIQLEPLLLIPFVENAFKHGISYNDKSRISIELVTKPGELSFMVENSKPSMKDTPKLEEPGIGLKNVRRRLELLYPGRHQLDIRDTESVYQIMLKIKI